MSQENSTPETNDECDSVCGFSPRPNRQNVFGDSYFMSREAPIEQYGMNYANNFCEPSSPSSPTMFSMSFAANNCGDPSTPSSPLCYSPPTTNSHVASPVILPSCQDPFRFPPLTVPQPIPIVGRDLQNRPQFQKMQTQIDDADLVEALMIYKASRSYSPQILSTTPFTPPMTPVPSFERRGSANSNYFQSPNRRRTTTTSTIGTGKKEPLVWREMGYQLVKNDYLNAEYSLKVFLGGLTCDTISLKLENQLRKFGVVRIQKQAKEGHAYLQFSNSRDVSNMLTHCERLGVNKGYYLQAADIAKSVQVIPWALQDIEWGQPFYAEDKRLPNTIFVGGVHGEITAEHLKMILEESFKQRVRYVLIDTDKLSYPKGSARVQFYSRETWMKAIETEFLIIHSKHYERRIQLQPYFEDKHRCTSCNSSSSVLCRSVQCLRYFCSPCFANHVREFSSFYPAACDEHRPVPDSSSKRRQYRP